MDTLDAQHLWCMAHDAVVPPSEIIEEGPATPTVCHVAMLVVGDGGDLRPTEPCEVVMAAVSVISPPLYRIAVKP